MVKQTAVADETDLDLIAADYEKLNSRRGLFRPKEPGEYLIRILPPAVKGRYYVQFGLHYDAADLAPGVPSDRRAVACLRYTLDQECPFDRAVDRLYRQARAGEIEDKTLLKRAGRARAKIRYAMNIVDMDNQKNGVLLWEIGTEAFNQLHAVFRRWKDVARPDWDLPKGEQQGQVLAVTFGMKDKYNTVTSVQPTGDNTPIEVKNWREQRKDLEAYVQQLVVPAEQMQAWLTAEVDATPLRRSDITNDVEEEPEAVVVPEGEEITDLDEDEETDDDSPLSGKVMQDPEVQRILRRARVK